MSRVVVIGAGAIGGYIGGKLQTTGYDVLLLDGWQAHIAAIQSGGLRLGGTETDQLVVIRADSWDNVGGFAGWADEVVIASKTYDLDRTIEVARIVSSPDGSVVVAQNGMTDERVGRALGKQRIVGCVVHMAAQLVSPGSIMRTDRREVGFLLAELAGSPTDRTHRLARMLDGVAATIVADDLAVERWSKLATNCMLNGVAGATGLDARETRARVDIVPIIIALGAETIRVAHASGVRPRFVLGVDAARILAADEGVGFDDVARELATYSATSLDSARPSLVGDLQTGRMTEIRDLNGFVLEVGQRVGVPTPVSAGLVELVAAIERGDKRPNPANVEPLAAIVGRHRVKRR